MFGVGRDKQAWPSGPQDQTAYVVGDIHGRLDLLNQLLEIIHRDIDQRHPTRALIVFLGDLLDRGPASAGVVERLRNYSRDGVRAVFLLGNHEEVLLRILGGEAQLIPGWLRFGGAQCLKSYGGDPVKIAQLGDEAAVAAIGAVIPPEHLEFLRSFSDTCKFGDYLFVHAGIRPGVELEQQSQQDLRWIREPFLADETDHGFVVIHGHTIRREIDERPNRIGIDTGAYATGVLTALVIDGPRRRHLDTRLPVAAAVSAMH
jgi:serine/threonine protein phosphatase 1